MKPDIRFIQKISSKIMKPKIILINLILVTTLLAIGSEAIAKIEEGVNNQNLVRGPLIVNDKIDVYSQDGLSFVNNSGNINDQIKLSRNDAGELLWNGNPIIDSTGMLAARNLNIPGGTGGGVLYQSDNNVTSSVERKNDSNIASEIKKQRSRPLMLRANAVDLNWVTIETLQVQPQAGMQNCDIACNQAAASNSNLSICTAAREGIFRVDCSTTVGSVSGVGHTCDCLRFNR